MNEFTVHSLTCSEVDSTWSMRLPPFTNEDVGNPIQIELVDKDLFELKRAAGKI